MIKITKNDKNKFNKTKDGKYFHKLKNKGLLMFIVCLMFTFFWVISDINEIYDDIGLIIIFILGAIGAFPVGLYYGKLYRFILDKNKG